MTPLDFAHPEQPGLASIVIPSHRGERFIGAALESIRRQTYEPWEVVVVEDGSQGLTQSIVEEFARRHPARRTEYLRNDRNRGAAFSRNRGFAACRGEFVAPLDADDRWYPEHLALSIDALTSGDADVAYGSVELIDDETESALGVLGPEGDDLAEFPACLFRRNFINPSATVLRRSVLAELGPWDETLRYCEDLGYWLRCIAAGKRFQHVGGRHCLYRKNHAGATTQRQCGTVEEFATIVERFLKLPGLPERACRRLVGKAYLRAAELHATTDCQRDPSADPSRAAALAWKAWRLRPEQVKYLWKAVRYSAAA